MVILLYDRLRGLARARMSGQRSSHTLDPTGLANEAIVRLLKCNPDQIKDEQHFLSLAAEAMRQILVDHARMKNAKKRGGENRAASLDSVEESAFQFRTDPAEVLALNEALVGLEKEDPEAATIVKMRSFAGMDCEEIAALMDTSKRTIERRWRYAMAELRERMGGDDTAGGVGDDQP